MSHVSLTMEVTVVLSLPWTFPLRSPALDQHGMVQWEGYLSPDQLATSHQDTAAVPEGLWSQCSLKTQTSKESLEINIEKHQYFGHQPRKHPKTSIQQCCFGAVGAEPCPSISKQPAPMGALHDEPK